MANPRREEKIKFIEDDTKGIITVIVKEGEPVRSVRGKRDDRVMHYYDENDELVRLELEDRPFPGAAEHARKLGISPDTPMLSLKYVAERIGVDASTLRRSVARGTLRAERFGSDWLTTEQWVEEYRAKRRGPGRPRRSA